MNIPLMATIGMIVANGVIPQIMDKSIKDVSRNHQSSVSPAKYTFSIWSFIYAGLTVMCVYTPKFQAVHYYLASCVLNCAWIVFWLKEHLVTSSMILVAMIGNLFMFWSANAGTHVGYQNILAAYLAWLTGAAALNGGFVLRDSLELTDETTSRIIIATVCLVQGVWQVVHHGSGRSQEESWAVPLVGVWTAVGMLSNGKQSTSPWLFLAVSVMCGIFQKLN